eukprot:Phypoly_transcript_01981.p1 GENE.Phypoly_transcript_01981~~Phypoly_transcript_01981.p1  ORF type:complete len:917 (+),score=93.92 Phypoly_transcript_01981:152-2902(+)
MSKSRELEVAVEGYNRISLRGRGTVVSYNIRVKQDDKEWVVYQTEEQFKTLDNLLHKKSQSLDSITPNNLKGSDSSFRIGGGGGGPRERRTPVFQRTAPDADFLWHNEAVQPDIEGFLWKRTGLQPSLEGFLWKKAAVHGIKGWNKRYFKLVGNTLFYSNDSGANVPKRGISLLDASMIVPSNESQTFKTDLVGGEILDGRMTFEIRMPNQVIHLNAPSRDVMEAWVGKLNTAKRNRYSQSPPPSRPRAGTMTEMEIAMYEQKRVNYDIFLKSLCDYYSNTDYLSNFLLINKYPNERNPQYRMMVDAIQSNLGLIVDLHETHGVPIDFVYKEVPFFSEACSVGAQQLVQYILSTEPESSVAELIKCTDKFGKTPLHSACSSACYEVALLLVQNGATVEVVDNVATPLHFIARCAEPVLDDYAKHSLETLIKALAPKCLNATDEYGQTPLHICVKKCYLPMLPILLNLGADYNIADHTGKNVLHLVACNGSAKALAVLNELLQFMGKNVRTLSDFTRNILLLEYCDNETKTALQYALQDPSCFRHVSLLQQHYARLEEYRFSMLTKDLMQQVPHIVISDDQKIISSMKDEFAKTFACIIEFLCSSCFVNEYHSDIIKLIEKTLDLCDRTFNVIKGIEMDDTAHALLVQGVQTGVYPVLHSLFLKKNKFHDNILNQNMLLFKSAVNYSGFGIPEKLWKIIEPNIEKGLEILRLLPTKVQPQEKLDCIADAIALFDCDGADDIVPCLAYLMVQGADPLGGVRWSAELDFISKLSPSGNFIILQGMLTFFQTASMKKKNGVIFIEGVDALASNTTHDLACLWMDLKREETGMDEMQAIYSLFLKCANNFSGVNEVVLDNTISESTLTNHYMKSILTRLQIVFPKSEEQGIMKVKYGDFVDQSIFAKIACSFANLPIHPSH